MDTTVDKMDLRSADIADEKKAQLKQLFPEVFNEGGKIDFDRLKLTLGASVDVGKERYGMNWAGKADCFKTIQEPSVATLIPSRDESVNFDTTENILIEGDNLEVLKLLQKSYFDKIKMIYIDPPYNTGNDFIYPDNYAESLETYLRYTGQIDAEGRKFSTNTETDGRFHSKWLNMMYPRLFVARNLLREDGIIFISIDDAEVDNLKKVCNEILGEENFIAQLVWEKGRKNDAKLFSVGHEYMLVFAKSLATLREHKTLWREQKAGAQEIWNEYVQLRKRLGSDNRRIEAELQRWFQGLDDKHPSKKLGRYRRVDANGPWRDHDISWPGSGGPRYDVLHPVTGKPCKVPEAGWRFATPEEMARQVRLGLVEFRDDHTEPPFRKTHIKPVYEEMDVDLNEDDEANGNDEGMATQVRGSYFYKQSQVAVKYFRKLMGAKVFDNPKDHTELLRLIRYVTSSGENDIVLDFFAGSGAIAEAVLQLNTEDQSDRRFILIQLPEPCNPKEKTGQAALAAGLNTVADITKERVRRVLNRLNSEDANRLPLGNGEKPDRGLRVFKLQSSNFRTWDHEIPRDPNVLAKQLEMHISHVLKDRGQEDLLFELLLKSGFPLSTPIRSATVANKHVFDVADGAMLICLENEITEELIRAIADMKPERVICLDEGFKGNDQLKTNAVQTMKMKGVTSFRTV